MRAAVAILAVLLAGCSVTRAADEALVDARRSELVLTREVTRTLREVAGVTSSAAALLDESRRPVAQVLDDARATTAELRSRAWLLWASAALLVGALLGVILRRRSLCVCSRSSS